MAREREPTTRQERRGSAQSETTGADEKAAKCTGNVTSGNLSRHFHRLERFSSASRVNLPRSRAMKRTVGSQ